jgi:hypothetical protein
MTVIHPINISNNNDKEVLSKKPTTPAIDHFKENGI